MARGLGSQRSQPRIQGRLGRAVGGPARGGDPGRDTGDRDDTAAACSAHRLQHRQQQGCWAQQIRPGEAHQVVGSPEALLEAAAEGVPGQRDHRFWCAVIGQDGLGELADCLLVAQVAGEHPGLSSGSPHLVGHGLQPVSVPSGEHQLLPARGQCQADAPADPAARPGDEDHRRSPRVFTRNLVDMRRGTAQHRAPRARERRAGASSDRAARHDPRRRNPHRPARARSGHRPGP